MRVLTSKMTTSERAVLIVTILGSSMAFIDGTAVNVSLPALEVAFKANLKDVQWVVESYALTLAALLLVGGALGDIYGRRKIYLFGIASFTLASMTCGLAPNVGVLIAARLIQGVGAALLIPGGLALISSAFTAEARGNAIGIWSGVSAVAAAIGPIMGGWLIEHASWRWVFFLNLPVAIAVIALARAVPESRNPATAREIDWIGAVLASLGLGSLTYALIEWSGSGQSKMSLLIIGGFGVLALLLFCVAERSARSPMLPLVLFRSRNFVAANMLTFLLYAALSGVLFLYPMDLIQVQGYTPLQAGGAFLPFILIMSCFSGVAGRLLHQFGGRASLSVGPLLVAGGFATLAAAPQNGTYWLSFFPGAVFLGIGMTASVAPLTTTAMNAVPTSEAGIASGINNAVSRVAALLAIAVFGGILVAVFNHSLDVQLSGVTLQPDLRSLVNAHRTELAAYAYRSPVVDGLVRGAFVTAYRFVLYLAAGFSLAGALVSWCLVVDTNAGQRLSPASGVC